MQLKLHIKFEHHTFEVPPDLFTIQKIGIL